MSNLKALNKEWLVALMAASLTACGGGGGDSNPPPSGSQPPPSQPAPPPPPPPPPTPGAPPLSSTVTDVTGGQRIGAVHWANGNTSNGGSGSTVQGIDCLTTMPDTYHIHSHLSIIRNGEALAIPTNIGIVANTPTCYFAIHTHDASGTIHVEAGAAGTFTLGQLFGIWGQTLSSTNVAGLTGLPVEVFVADGGSVAKVDNNWDAIDFRSKRLIYIVVGTPVTELPNFTWSGD
jgi:hypothetical protein